MRKNLIFSQSTEVHHAKHHSMPGQFQAEEAVKFYVSVFAAGQDLQSQPNLAVR
jgi:hypothetical protein